MERQSSKVLEDTGIDGLIQSALQKWDSSRTETRQPFRRFPAAASVAQQPGILHPASPSSIAWDFLHCAVHTRGLILPNRRVRTRTHGGVTGKANDRLPMSITTSLVWRWPISWRARLGPYSPVASRGESRRKGSGSRWSDAPTMAREFQSENSLEICRALNRELEGVSIQFEPHIESKKRIPRAIGIIRMGTSLGMETSS